MNAHLFALLAESTRITPLIVRTHASTEMLVVTVLEVLNLAVSALMVSTLTMEPAFQLMSVAVLILMACTGRYVY